MIGCISDLAPENVEAGTGLAGQDQIVLEDRVYPIGTAAALSRILSAASATR